MARIVLAVILSLTVSGCANWSNIFRAQNPESNSSSLLKKSQMSDDSVVLEISIIDIPLEQRPKIESLFKTLDVTRIDLEQRQAWDRNGLRVAAGGNAMPLEYEQILNSEIKEEEQAGESRDETKTAPRRRIQSRSGKPFRIATRSVSPELTWFTINKDGYRQGASKHAAQTEFEVRSYAQGDGSIKLMIVPEIAYGESKQVVTTSNASLRYEMKRDTVDFPGMRLEAVLHLGESLVMAAGTNENSSQGGQPFFGLGKAFFGGEGDQCKIVVIRLAQSQRDDLFDSSQNSQPLESVTE